MDEYREVDSGDRARVVPEVVPGVDLEEVERPVASVPLEIDDATRHPGRPARGLFVVSREADHVEEPVTIERLAQPPLILSDAQYGADDLMRRQLLDRAQRANITVRPVIEVEHIEAAVGLVRRGLGDTIVPRSAIRRQGGRGLHFASFADPLDDTFAFIARSTRPSAPPSAPLEIVETLRR